MKPFGGRNDTWLQVNLDLLVFNRRRVQQRLIAKNDGQKMVDDKNETGEMRMRTFRLGLSLLELLVVLTILIALGGIVVSQLPGLLGRTEVATAAANVKEIDSAIRRNLMLNQGQIGDRFDSLVTGGGTADGSIPIYVGGAENFEAVGLTQPELESLSGLGITEVITASDDAEDATFDSHVQLPIKIGQESKLCALKSEVAIERMPLDWNFEAVEGAKYLVFGLGKQCTLVGAGPKALFTKPPSQFSNNKNQNTKTMYSRYLILVELNPVSESQVNARYVGVGIPGNKGIQSVSDQLESYSKTQ